MSNIYLYLGLYIALLIVISYLISRKQGEEDFLIGGRKRGGAIFSYSNMFQICYSADTKSKLKHGIGMAVIPVLIVGFFLLLIGMFMASQVQGLDSGLIFTEALKNFLPASFLPLGIVLFFAGIMRSMSLLFYWRALANPLSPNNLLNL
ncbi:MAG: hypothetical protein U9M92_01170 [Patescibacteria group bacterium]|nr:hypothetical protein [Patescibacteria group bacterium]